MISRYRPIKRLSAILLLYLMAPVGSKSLANPVISLGSGDHMCENECWTGKPLKHCPNEDAEEYCRNLRNNNYQLLNGASGIYPEKAFYKETSKAQDMNHLLLLGHAEPKAFSVKSKLFYLSNARFGFSGSKIRHLWAFSCRLFAHGDGPQFDKPAAFSRTSSADIFSAWTFGTGRPFGDKLRLACGMSTNVLKWSYSIAGPLHYLEKEKSRVSEAFLLGMSDLKARIVPICITRSSEEDHLKSPLADVTLATNKNQSTENGFVFIEYPIISELNIPTQSPLRLLTSQEAPTEQIDRAPPAAFIATDMPIFDLASGALPTWLSELPPGQDGFITVSKEQLPPTFRPLVNGLQDFELRAHRASGGIIITSKSLGQRKSSSCSDLASLAKLAENIGNPAGSHLDSPMRFASSSPSSRHLIVDRAKQSDINSAKHFDEIKHVSSVARTERQLLAPYSQADGTSSIRFIPIEGLGSGEALTCDAPLDEWGWKATPFSGFGRAAISIYSPRVLASNFGKIRSPAEAAGIAEDRLKELSPVGMAYKLRSGKARWAYKIPPLHCISAKSYLFYIFDYVPVDEELSMPALRIEIPAHLAAESEEFAQCTGGSG